MSLETIRPSDLHALSCPTCGAACPAGAIQCWLCEEKLAESSPAGGAAAPVGAHPATPHQRASFSFSISTLLLAMTLVAIAAALIAAEPGLGVSFCILLAPVLVRTAMVVQRRKEAGREVPLGQKAALIGTSFVVANVILTVVCVAAVGSFCGICLGLAAATGNQRLWPIFMLLSGSVAIVVTCWTLWKMGRWVRRRYHQDVESPGNEP